MDSFWTNTIWYIMLGILTLIQLTIVMLKNKSRSLNLAFYITILGIILTFEMIILIYLGAYTYYPMILKNPPLPFDDMLAGNLFSQFTVSATVLLVSVLNLNLFWFLIFPIGYGIIEESFKALGIYSQNWYQTWMTVTLLPAGFGIARKMYEAIKSGIKPVFYYIYVYFGLFPLNIINLNWGLQLLRIQDFSLALLPDPIMSRHFLVLMQFFLLSVPMMIIYFRQLKGIRAALLIIIIYIIYYAGWQMDLIIMKPGWFWPASTISLIWMYLSILVLDRLYGGFKNRIK
ncbi:hypothetical protein ASZ90_017171 [hydrocarbon metagenome]|uniref:Uncharacterized protein n=1 Tax=hydrocarbon metagenome TaxID=938273 RepID=A0A0W8E9R1_9ZZZZ